MMKMWSVSAGCLVLGMWLAQAQEMAMPANIAGGSHVTVNSWLERMTGDYLVDGNTAFIYRKTGWTSGTRFPVYDGIFREEPIVFDFHRAEPAEVSGVELFSRSAICFAVDIHDGKKWIEVARNAEKPGYRQPLPSSRVSFAPQRAFSVRVRLLGYASAPDTETSEHYLLGEVKIYGQLHGADLAAGLTMRCGSDADRTVEPGQALTVPFDVEWTKLPEGTAWTDYAADITLSRRFGSQSVRAMSLEKVSAKTMPLSFGVLPPGIYTLRVTLRHSPTGAMVKRAESLIGVRSAAWSRGEIEAFPAGKEADLAPLGLSASGEGPQKFVRCADINGLDDVRETLDLDYYLKAARDAGAVADVFLPWSLLEPLPGVYDFDLADRWFESAGKWGVRLRLNLNPPLSGYLPSWLQGQQIVELFKDGTRQDILMGSLFSPLVRKHAPRLFELLMKRYGNHPAAAFWVLNVNGEYLWRLHENRYEDASPMAVTAFRQALQKQYGTIGALNQEWGSQYASFDSIQAPVRGANAAWTHYCDFMLKETTAFYEPIAAQARRLLGEKAILLTTAGHLTAEPFVGLAQRYHLWQSNHSQENPQFISWAALWRSHGIVRFGEPGYVNVELLDVNRTFFINAVGGVVVSTFRQYGWPNATSWPAFQNQQTLGDKLVNAEPMRLPLVLAGTFESGLLNGSNTFSVGGVWNPVGCYNDALLKMGAVADFYDGHNPQVLTKAKAVLELGSSILRESTIREMARYVQEGGHLVLFPPLTGTTGHRLWEQPEKNGDLLLKSLGADANFTPLYPYESKEVRLASPPKGTWLSGLGDVSMNGFWNLPATLPPGGAVDLQSNSGRNAIVQWPWGKGTVTGLAGHFPDRRQTGNGRRNAGGTGWNIAYNSPETETFLRLLLAREKITLPYELNPHHPAIWSCGFVVGTTRYILLYNNAENESVSVTIKDRNRAHFPADFYQIKTYGLRTQLHVSALAEKQSVTQPIDVTVEPYGLCLVELIPSSR